MLYLANRNFKISYYKYFKRINTKYVQRIKGKHIQRIKRKYGLNECTNRKANKRKL